MAGSLGQGCTNGAMERGGGYRASAISATSSTFTVENQPDTSDYYPAVANPERRNCYDTLWHSDISNLSLRSDLYPAEEISDHTAQHFTSEQAKTQVLGYIRQKHTVKNLVLDHNQLRHYPPELCVPSIEVLSVQSQVEPEKAWENRWPALKDLPEEMGKMRNLRVLNLTNNAVERLPDSLAQLDMLESVDLRLNYLRVFPASLLASRSLREVNFTANYICEVPPEIGEMSQLEILVLDKNNITVLPKELRKLQKLKVLSVRNNERLNRLPRTLHECQALEEVRVHGNTMEYPPVGVCNKGSKEILTYLKRMSDRTSKEDSAPEVGSYSERPAGQILIVKNENLKTLDDALKKKASKNLDTLDASNNLLTSLPNSLGNYKMLHTLNLDNNQIVDFPIETLRQLKVLKKLNLSNQHDANKRCLDEIHVLIKYIITLQELYLCYNGIRTFPKGIPHLVNLRILDLEGNSFPSLHPRISELTHLEYLGLNKVGLTSLPDNICKLKHLKVLRLSKNELVELPDSVCELEQLQLLSLKHNRLQRLPQCFFKLTGLLGDNLYETMGLRFHNGCSLDYNPDLQFPPLKEVKRGLETMMDYMKHVYEYPDSNDEEDQFNESATKRASGVDSTQDLTMPATPLQEPAADPRDTLSGPGPELPDPSVPNRPNQHLSDRFLSRVSQQLGPEWFHLGVMMGIPHDTLTCIQHDHRYSTQRQSLEMLIEWRHRCHEESERQKEMLVRQLNEIRRTDIAEAVEDLPLE